MFEKFKFSPKQIDKYYRAARKDFKIAKEAVVPEVSFRFCYDSVLKLAITVCADNGLRVKSRAGHHVELINKLSLYFNDPEIEIMANEMRTKRNWDLYGGGVMISSKEASGYISWTEQIIEKGKKYFNITRPRLDI